MQSTLDPHLRSKETIAAYLESSFHAVAIQWLVETDQPIQALQHPAFKNMIDIAS
ncbi:hypothetical protein SCLCIDRAFT_121168 [Scleroderma citrinum Foug A]|uniref:Uncharacterized protein n=1 Tax=Scleroderma citrinum Foug A TaxID=1036808 RepID=A0A0C3DM75_9AGAM|nr:hypothetical protein SCLCIDRAFT_121168 [Scleroderma citrinum Foug A]